MVHKFQYLNNSNPGDLARVKLNNSSSLAIIGAIEAGARRGIIILEKNQPPAYELFMQQGMIDGDFEHYQMLSYGGDYEITPAEDGDCQVGTGDLFNTPGALIFTKSERLLVVNERPSAVRYFNLNTNLMQGEPGEYTRAAFAEWTLRLKDTHDSIFKFGCSNR